MARTWTSQPPGLKAVRLNVPEDTHRRLMVLAAEAGVQMAPYARRLVELLCSKGAVTVADAKASFEKEKASGDEKPAAKSKKQKKS